MCIRDRLIAIPDNAFYNCSITSIKIPDGVTVIGDSAFYRCRSIRGDLVLPDNVRSVGAHAFEFCGFDGQLFLNVMLREIKEYAFSRSQFTGKLTIPTKVEYIGDYAFSYCKGFTELDFTLESELGEAKLSIIGEGAFEHCAGFKGDLVFPDNLEKIGSRAFNESFFGGRSGNLVMGKKIKELGGLAFTYLDSDRACCILSKVYFKSSVPPVSYTHLTLPTN